MDNININSSFDNLDLNVLSSTKEEMDILSSTKEEMDSRKDLDVYQRNGAEEQNRKVSLRTISPAIQEKQSNFQQPKPSQLSTTDDYKSKWSNNYYNFPMGRPLLSLHDKLSPHKERPQDKKTEIHISEPGEIPYLPSRPNSAMDNYNGAQSKVLSSNDQCILEAKSESGKDYQRCLWCVNFSQQTGKKDRIDFSPTKERPISSSSGPEWEYSSIPRNVGVRELRGDECLEFFMSDLSGSPDRVSNHINLFKNSNIDMQELPSLSELVRTIKNDHEFCEFYEPKDKWLIDQENKEYFRDTYNITNIHPLFVDRYGVSLIFLDDRGILFEWCEMTQDISIFGINKMEGLANLLYHPEKRCAIKETGELVPYVELKRQAMEKLKMAKV